MTIDLGWVQRTARVKGMLAMIDALVAAKPDDILELDASDAPLYENIVGALADAPAVKALRTGLQAIADRRSVMLPPQVLADFKQLTAHYAGLANASRMEKAGLYGEDGKGSIRAMREAVIFDHIASTLGNVAYRLENKYQAKQQENQNQSHQSLRS